MVVSIAVQVVAVPAGIDPKGSVSTSRSLIRSPASNRRQDIIIDPKTSATCLGVS
jgi:hypothetical protein